MGSPKYKPYVLCIGLNPFKHEGGSVRWFTPFSNQDQKPVSNAEQSQVLTLLGVSPTKETQATERLYKDAPPSALRIILFYKLEPSDISIKLIKLFSPYFI